MTKQPTRKNDIFLIQSLLNMSNTPKRIITVVFETDEDGWYIASVPNIPGCYTQGKTLEEAKQRIHEVVEMYNDEILADLPSTQPNFFAVEHITL